MGRASEEGVGRSPEGGLRWQRQMTEQVPEKKSVTLWAREPWQWNLLLRITQSNTSIFPLTSQEIIKTLVKILWGLEWMKWIFGILKAEVCEEWELWLNMGEWVKCGRMRLEEAEAKGIAFKSSPSGMAKEGQEDPVAGRTPTYSMHVSNKTNFVADKDKGKDSKGTRFSVWTNRIWN